MTPRIRSVKPELFCHEALFVAEITHQFPLRIAFIGLFTCCDREGRFRWHPRRLKVAILPYDESDINQVLDALLSSGFIKKYEYQNETFGYIPSWSRHQYINNREAESILPGPEGFDQPKIINRNKNKEVSDEEDSEMDACSTRPSRVVDAPRACSSIKERKGRERKGRERNNTVVAQARPSVGDSPVNQVFSHWKTVMNHPGAMLDNKRKSMITNALKAGYSVDQLCDAITGCSYTPHNMGKNDRGQCYDGLHVILRDGDQIDRFIRNYQHPPRSLNEAERRSQANVHALQDWMEGKFRGADNGRA